MWTMKRTRVCAILLGVLIVALAMMAAACGGSSESTSTSSTAAPTTTSAPTTSSSASSATAGASSTSSSALSGDEATIAANWVKFFDGTLSAQDKIGLLENGQQYAKQIEAQAASPLTKMATAAVSSVTITSPTTADVKYSILVGGTPALLDQMGKVIQQDGVWKVGADSFLALLALQQGSLSTSTTTP